MKTTRFLGATLVAWRALDGETGEWAEPAGLAFEMVPEKDPTRLRTTDEDGRVTFRLERSGRWLLRCTDLRQSRTDDVDRGSDFTTLTVEVR